MGKLYKPISTMAFKLQLNGDGDIKTAIVNRANELYKNSDRKHGRGQGCGPEKIDRAMVRDAKAAACMYIACREEELPISLNNIEDASKICRREICKSFSLVLNGDEARWLCEVLSLSTEVKEAVTSITKKTRNLGIVSESNSNIGVALAAIYMVCQASDDKRKWKKTKISDLTGFHTMTISKYYKLMRSRAAELFPEGFSSTLIENLPKP